MAHWPANRNAKRCLTLNSDGLRQVPGESGNADWRTCAADEPVSCD